MPEILGYDGEWLIQEDLGSRRLSEALLRDSPDAVEKWLRTACESLAAIHRAGRQAGLERQVVALGQTRKWLQKLVATPDRVGRYLNLPAPDLDAEAIVAALSPGEPWFIKWDARPGNAVAATTGGWPGSIGSIAAVETASTTWPGCSAMSMYSTGRIRRLVLSGIPQMAPPNRWKK